jgi:hypothetical protein
MNGANCAGRRLEHAGFKPSFFKRPLQSGFMDMLSAVFSCRSVNVMTCGGKTPAAIPILGRRSEFVVEGHSVKILRLILLHHR